MPRHDAEALLGMGLGLHDRLDQRDRLPGRSCRLAHHALPASIRRNGDARSACARGWSCAVRDAERAWLATRWPLWKTSTVAPVMRASTVSRISRERHRVVMVVDLDVIVGRDAARFHSAYGRARSAAHSAPDGRCVSSSSLRLLPSGASPWR